EEPLVLLAQSRRQLAELADGQRSALDGVERLLRIKEVAGGSGGKTLRGRRDVAGRDTDRLAGEARGDVVLEILNVLRILRAQDSRLQAAQLIEHVALAAARRHDLQPLWQPVDLPREESDDGDAARLRLHTLVECVDDEHPRALARRAGPRERSEDAFLEGALRIAIAAALAEHVTVRRPIEQRLVSRMAAGDHRRDAAHKAAGSERVGYVDLAAVVGEHAAEQIAMNDFRRDCRLADARLADDQKRRRRAGVEPPRDLVEQPGAAGEVPPLALDERAEVPRLQAFHRRALPRHAAQRVGDALEEPGKRGRIPRLVVAPGGEIDVVESENLERRLARNC